jgi:ABC-type Na+ transport system ATPase subunit NatA
MEHDQDVQTHLVGSFSLPLPSSRPGIPARRGKGPLFDAVAIGESRELVSVGKRSTVDIVIRTIGLGKRYGKTEALAPLDLELAQGEALGYLGPNGAGKTTTIRLLLAFARPTAGRAELFGLDAQRDAVAVHRRLAYVPGEATLWPALTGAETLHLLGRVHGGADQGYRDELVERFALDPTKKVRAYSKATGRSSR